jgi:competence protein ComGC
MSQAFLTGIPIVALVREIPETFYLVLTLLIFILCMVILLLIFLPKVLMQRAYANMSAADRTKMMAASVRKSALQFSTISGLNSARDGSHYGFSSKNQDGSAGCFSLKAHEGSADNLSGTLSGPFEKNQDVTLSAPFEKASGAVSGSLSPPFENEQVVEATEEEENDDLTTEDEVANDVAETKGCFGDDNNKGGHSEADPLWAACGTTTVEA